MNRLNKLLLNDWVTSETRANGNEDKFYNRMCGGSIIAFIDDHKGCFEIHGDTTTGKLFVLKMCIKQLASDLDIPVDEIMDFLTNALKTEDRPF